MKKYAHYIFIVGLFLCLYGALQVRPVRWDMTDDKHYSLSEASKALLRQTDEPIEVTLLVFVAMGIWNDYLLSSLFLQTQDMRTLPMMIRVFCAQYSTDYSPMMAGLVMSISPMLIFYLLCQKQILAGVVQGSVKG